MEVGSQQDEGDSNVKNVRERLVNHTNNCPSILLGLNTHTLPVGTYVTSRHRERVHAV